MRLLFTILSVTLIITLSCDNQEDLPNPPLTGGEKDTLIYFTGEIFDTTYSWVKFHSQSDTLVMGYSSIDPYYKTPDSRELVSGISYGPFCCENVPEKINKRIAIHAIDSIHYDPNNSEDRERLKLLFETGRKRVGQFCNPYFLPPEVVLKRGECDLIFKEFEVEYIENIDDSLHYYSTKWGPGDVWGPHEQNNILEIIDNEGYYTCIDSFDEETHLCETKERFVTFYIDCKLYNYNNEFVTQVTGEFRSEFLIY